MIYSIFRSNQPFIALLFPLLAVIPVWLGYAFPLPATEDFAPLFPEYHTVIKENFWIGAILRWSAISLGALLTNRLLNQFDFLAEATHLPGLFYVVILCFYPVTDFRFLWAMVFFIMATTKLLRAPMSKRAASPLFESGLLIGVSSVIHPLFLLSCIVLPFASTIGRKPNLREFLLPWLGLAFFIWLFLGCMFLFWPLALKHIMEIEIFKSAPQLPPLNLMIASVLCTLFCLPLVNSYSGSTNKSRNEKTIFFISCVSLLSIAIGGYFVFTANLISLMAFPGAALLGFYFQTKSKRTRLKNLLFYLILAFFTLGGHLIG